MDGITFLGTAGARFVTMRQARASGGFFLSLGGVRVFVDPGPGALVRALRRRPPIDLSALDGIYLSHKHLDHSADVNILIEAMTGGGFTRRGALFAPGDALGDDPVLLRYLRPTLARIETLRPGGSHRLDGLLIETPVRHAHGVETYGCLFSRPGGPRLGYVADTRLFAGLAEAYRGCDVLIVNTVLAEPLPGIDHLSLPEAGELIAAAVPRAVVLTHFGTTMLDRRIAGRVRSLSRRLGVRIVAARDGMTFPLDPVVAPVS